jgi:hypothetical protein
LTVLTDPVPCGPERIPEPTRRALRRIRSMVVPAPGARPAYRGHFGVTRSLIEGAHRLDVAVNYNPWRLADVAPTVVVLSGLTALRQAIGWRRSGRIHRLLAGPNLVDFPSDQRELLCAPEVDLCLTPAALTCEMYVEDCPELTGRCAAWAAGVDAGYWSPALVERDPRHVVVFHKPTRNLHVSPRPFLEMLVARGYTTTNVQYGSYTAAGYRSALRRASLLVGFSASESQGIAMAEAWSTDVPTLLWYQDSFSYLHPRAGERIVRSSTAPYLSQATGRFFTNVDEFANGLDALSTPSPCVQPRRWVLAHMSDEASAKRLLDLAGIPI